MIEPKFGDLNVVPAMSRPDFLAVPTLKAVEALSESADIGVTEIDPSFSDTAAFCERYKLGMETAANCVIIKATRGETTRYAACLVLATTRADVNGLVRRHLDARKASFAPMEEAVALTQMEYGGITPIGLPPEWPILIDKAVADSARLIVGSGVRKSKIVISGMILARLPNTTVIEGLGVMKSN